MGDAPKSAFEIAMEKLRLRDQERGEAAPAALTGDQRRAIAEIRTRYQAKLAEVEILHKANLRKAADAEAIAKLEEEYAVDRRRIEEQREREIARVRGERGKPPTSRSRPAKARGDD